MKIDILKTKNLKWKRYPLFGILFYKTIFLFVNQKMGGSLKNFLFGTLVSFLILKNVLVSFIILKNVLFFFLRGSHAIFQNRLALFWPFSKPNSFLLFWTVAQIKFIFIVLNRCTDHTRVFSLLHYNNLNSISSCNSLQPPELFSSLLHHYLTIPNGYI